MGLLSGPNIGEPKADLSAEAVKLEELGAVQGKIGQTVTETVMQGTAGLAQALANALKLARANAETVKSVAGQQVGVAKGVKTQAQRLAATAEGTDNQDLTGAVQALASQIEPTSRYSDTLTGVRKFNDDAVVALNGLLEALNGGQLQTLQTTGENMNTSAGILAQAAGAAATHAPNM